MDQVSANSCLMHKPSHLTLEGDKGGQDLALDYSRC